VGESLREIRRRQGHSLDTLAKASGVSRAMLGQIETGKSAPTVTLLWKIAKALDVPVARLIAPSEGESCEIERKAAARILAASGGRFQSRAIARSDGATEPVLKELRIAPGHRERIAAARTPAHLTLVVGRGTVDIAIAGQAATRLAEGDAVFFSSMHEHVLSNGGTEEGILYLVTAPARSCRR